MRPPPSPPRQMQMTVRSEVPSYGFVLFVVFLVLKLSGVITWSWWWVTAPLWAGTLLLLVLGMTFAAVAYLLLTYKARKHIKAKLGARND